MRIISGKFRGGKINLPVDKNTRPLRDLVKESIFNLILHSNKFKLTIKGSNVIDIFSGTGSFGLECISREANKVIFVENYGKAIQILKKNINSFKIKNFKIIEENCFNVFDFKNNFNERFDIIFIDPPFREKKINLIIDTIIEGNILSDSGIVIVHRHKKDLVKISKKLKILDERNYGISKIIIGN